MSPKHTRPETVASVENVPNPVLTKVLEDLEEARLRHGDSHCTVADAWNALGLVRIHMDRNAEAARDCQLKALEIYRSCLQYKESAIALSDLAYCFEQLGEQESALQKYQESLDLLKKSQLSEEHPLVLSTRRAVSRVRRE